MKSTYSWIARFYVSGSILITALMALFDPSAWHRGSMVAQGWGGYAAMALLGAVAVFGILDVLINDWLPKRFSLVCTHRHRHVVYMLMSMGQTILVLVAAQAGDIRPGMARYVLDAVVSVMVAGYGVIDHYKRGVRP